MKKMISFKEMVSLRNYWKVVLIVIATCTIIGGYILRECFNSFTVMVLTILIAQLSYIGALFFKNDLKRMTEIMPDILVCVSLASVIYDALNMDKEPTTFKSVLFYTIPLFFVIFYFFKFAIMANRASHQDSVAAVLIREKIIGLINHPGTWTTKIDYASLINQQACNHADIRIIDSVLDKMNQANEIRFIQASMKYVGKKRDNKLRSIHKFRIYGKTVTIAHPDAPADSH
ncbi:hypothetical protein IBT47_02700 [Erwinia sp. S43]|uniref:hypothetical protein n=1 Tax=Erwinia sp. S43 TaxID=2769339 RepID=UPI001F4218F5|nr:hypothetical protein [Erwinia sp. S43]MBK0031183.1 hypothetical protein [Erwinia sp. S43]